MNDYFKSQLKKYLEDITFWYTDEYTFKIEENKKEMRLKIKKKEYDDDQYVLLGCWGNNYYLMGCVQIEYIRKDIEKKIKKYDKWVKEGNKL